MPDEFLVVSTLLKTCTNLSSKDSSEKLAALYYHLSDPGNRPEVLMWLFAILFYEMRSKVYPTFA